MLVKYLHHIVFIIYLCTIETNMPFSMPIQII